SLVCSVVTCIRCRLMWLSLLSVCRSFFSPATATSELYTLSLHDALPILRRRCSARVGVRASLLDAAHVCKPRVGPARAAAARRAGMAHAGARPVDAAVPVDRREHDAAPGRGCRTVAVVGPAVLRARRGLRGAR